MKCSDAMVLGSVSRRPQGGNYFAKNNGACALGMAGFAIGLSEHSMTEFIQGMDRAWPWLINALVPSPCGCHDPHFEGCRSLNAYPVGQMITHLFDNHVEFKKDWAFEQLVEWVRSVEPAEPAPATNELQQALEAEYARQS